MALIPNFGPSPSQIRAAGGSLDASGNVYWPLQGSRTTIPSAATSVPASLQRLTAFSSPYSSGGSRSSSFSSGVTQQANIANLANAPAIGAQAAGIARTTAGALDPFVSERFYAGLERAFPGYRDMFSQMQGNTMDMLRGEVPSDVADMVRMFSAEQQQQGTHAATARNLGLTSLDMATRGFGQGMDLFGLANRYLTAPTYDVFGATDQIRGQMLAAGLVSPSQLGSLELSLRSQDIQRQQEESRLALEYDKLRFSKSRFNAEMDWTRELDSMNRKWNDMLYDRQQQIYNDIINARTTEQEKLLDAFRNPSGTLDQQSRTLTLDTTGKWQDGPSHRTQPGGTAGQYSRVPNIPDTGFSGVPSGPVSYPGISNPFFTSGL